MPKAHSMLVPDYSTGTEREVLRDLGDRISGMLELFISGNYVNPQGEELGDHPYCVELAAGLKGLTDLRDKWEKEEPSST